MKFVQNSDEYIKKDEFKSAYNYQQKAIDDKLGEMKNYIDKIQEVVSLRFGGDLGKNKYDTELESLDTKINGIKNDVSNHEQNLHKELESAIENKFVKINEVDNKTEDVNKKLQNIEQNIDEAKKKIDNYTGDFKEEVEKLKKEGKNKLTIVMQGKKIEKLAQEKDELKKQLDKKIDGVNTELKDIVEKNREEFKNNLENKIKELNYQDTLNDIETTENKLKLLAQENEELRKKNEMLENEVQKVMLIAIDLEKKYNSSLSKEIDKIAENKTRAIHNKYEKQLREKIKLIEKRMKEQTKNTKSVKLLPEPNFEEDIYRYTPIEEDDIDWGIRPVDKKKIKRSAGTNSKFKIDIPIEEDEQLLFKPKKNQILGWFNKNG